MRLFNIKRWLTTGLLTLCAGVAMAQAWTPSTVRIIVPYPPGTEPDVLARDLGNALAKDTGKVFVVENKPGANSMIGTDTVAKADGDGATLLMVDRLAIVTNPLLYAKVPYQWETSLRPISDLATVHLFVGVREGLPVKTFAELINYAKAHPKKVNVGTGGNGHVTHIGMEMLAQASDVSWTYVPYKGVAPAVQGMLTSEVDAVMAGGLALQALAKTGKVRMVVVGADKRASFAPDVPTLAEAGGVVGSIPSTVFSLIGPAKIPDALAQQISRAVAQVMSKPELKEKYESRGLVVTPTAPEQTLQLMKKEAVKYAQIIREAGIKIDQ